MILTLSKYWRGSPGKVPAESLFQLAKEQEVVEKTNRTSLAAAFFLRHRDLVHVFARIVPVQSK
jgi:hypothetical protein